MVFIAQVVVEPPTIAPYLLKTIPMDEREEPLFRRALGAAQSRSWDMAIHFYDEFLKKYPDSYISWNNRGACKVDKAKEQNDLALAVQGRAEIDHAIRLAQQQYGGYQMAENNIKWADEVITDLTAKNSN